MPKLPHLSGAEIQRALERLGFQKVRQSGSHVIMKRNAKGRVIPMYGEVKVGTLAGVLRRADLAGSVFASIVTRD